MPRIQRYELSEFQNQIVKPRMYAILSLGQRFVVITIDHFDLMALTSEDAVRQHVSARVRVAMWLLPPLMLTHDKGSHHE